MTSKLSKKLSKGATSKHPITERELDQAIQWMRNMEKARKKQIKIVKSLLNEMEANGADVSDFLMGE